MLFATRRTTLGKSRGRLVVINGTYINWNLPPPPYGHDGFERWRDLLNVRIRMLSRDIDLSTVFMHAISS